MLKHGAMRGNRPTPEYATWRSMKRRCFSDRAINYADYGGRGITVCARWRESFENFLADMGPRPSMQHSIDRINVNGNYEPENCRWATIAEQNRNKRSVRIFTIGDRTQCLAEWAREAGLHIDTVCNRLRRGWPIEEALSPPFEGINCVARRSTSHTWTSSNQLRILGALANGPARSGELPCVNGGKRLRRMVERGLICRLTTGRVSAYRITEKGLEELKAPPPLAA